MDAAADDRGSPRHVGDHRLGGEPALDQPRPARCWTTCLRRPGRRLQTLVTITRNCAGITSNRSELSSPITVIVAPASTGTRCPQAPASPRSAAGGAAMHRGSRGVWQRCPEHHADPLLRLGAVRLSRSPSSIASKASCSCSSGRRSEQGPKCRRLSCSSSGAVGRSVSVEYPVPVPVHHARRASHRVRQLSPSTSARNASMPSGRFCMSLHGESIRDESYAAVTGQIPFAVWTRVQSSPSKDSSD